MGNSWYPNFELRAESWTRLGRGVGEPGGCGPIQLDVSSCDEIQLVDGLMAQDAVICKKRPRCASWPLRCVSDKHLNLRCHVLRTKL